jgi:hypothetical protein
MRIVQTIWSSLVIGGLDIGNKARKIQFCWRVTYIRELAYRGRDMGKKTPYLWVLAIDTVFAVCVAIIRRIIAALRISLAACSYVAIIRRIIAANEGWTLVAHVSASRQLPSNYHE